MADVSERDGATSDGPWITIRGAISEAELDAACRERRVPAGRSLRRLWQGMGLFPLPAADGRSEASYHPGAVDLAELLHEILSDESAGEHEALRVAEETVGLLRRDADGGGDPAEAEERLARAVRRHLEHGASPPADGARPRGEPFARFADRAPDPRPHRWTTLDGSITVAELERACAARGVRLNRARRTYWQAERAFPQPERRLLRPPEARGGLRGYYHPGTVDLACLIDYVTRPDHPAKADPWKLRVRDLGHVLEGWRAQVGAEDAFYEFLSQLMPLVEEGQAIPGLTPRHRDVLPTSQRRFNDVDRVDALATAGRVAEAIADGWVAEHADEQPPKRLVVWFRLERTGPANWRIADAGARRTRHWADHSHDLANSDA
ncbi:MAG: hypothetical protein AB7V42_11285 [Thermoleophilia bacterium]